MKIQYLVFTLLLFLLITIIPVNTKAQEGDILAGTAFAFCASPRFSGPGINFRAYYHLADNLRVAPDFTFYFTDNYNNYPLETTTKFLEANANAHYVMEILPNLNVYGLGGLNISRYSYQTDEFRKKTFFDKRVGIGFNAGFGGTYYVTDNIGGFIETKYCITDKDLGHFFTGIGVLFRIP